MMNDSIDKPNMYLFGVPRILQSNREIHLHRRKMYALLAYMSFAKHQLHRDTIAALLWPDHDTTHSHNNLRVVLSDIHKIIGLDILPVTNELIGPLELKRISVDTEEFQIMMDQIRLNLSAGTGQIIKKTQIREEDAMELNRNLLQKAVYLYKGDFMSGFNLGDCRKFSDWQFQQGEYLRRELCSALESLVSICKQEGDYEEGIAYCRKFVEVDNLNEEAHCLLMRLYAESGQRQAALHQFRLCEKTLYEELELKPEETTLELYESIRHSRPEKIQPVQSMRPEKTHFEVMPIKILGSMKNNLPVQGTVFIGRHRYQTEITHLIVEERQRLVTLSGPGGTGKTRLALQIGTILINHFDQGSWFVDLSQIQQNDGIISAMAAALKIPMLKGKEKYQQIIDFLRKRSLLLILDNFEQLLPDTNIIDRILSDCPGVVIIVTSREILQLYGEYEYSVEPMEYPQENGENNLEDISRYEAVTLFVQRARAVKDDFSINEYNASAIVGICSQLEGLPLAIELAASRSKIFPPRQLMKKLDDKLGFLTGSVRNKSLRQQTIRETIEWSYKLLSTEEQIFLKRLSIFQNGCSINAVDGICMKELSFDGLAGLESLMNKSLVMQREDALEEPRFFMLDIIREFAFESLSTSSNYPELESRFLEYYSDYTEKVEISLFDINKRSTAIVAIGIEYENIRKTIQWYFDHENYDKAFHLHICLLYFYDTGFRLDVFFHFAKLTMEHIHKTTGKTKGYGFECLGIYYLRHHEFDKTLIYLMDAMNIYKDAGLDIYAARAKVIAAAFYMGQKDNISESRKMVSEALEVFQKNNEKLLEIDSYNIWGI